MKFPEKITALLEKLIADGESLEKKAHYENGFRIVGDKDKLKAWANELLLFKSLTKDLVRPWLHNLDHNGHVIAASHLEQPISALKTIKYAMNEGLLARYEDLIFAEAFADLTEQANYLLSEGYFLAAGVILRAVLEERLRKLCQQHACLPQKQRPTIENLNAALYTAQPPVYGKTVMHHVTAMAAVGNDAAHNSQTLKKEDVERLARDVVQFLAQYGA